MLVANMSEPCGDSVEEWLGPDEAMIRKHVRAVSEMLARTEANLQMQRAVIAEEPARGDVALGRNFDLGKQCLDELLLSLAQLVPGRATVKTIKGQRIAGFERGHCAGAPRAGAVCRQ